MGKLDYRRLSRSAYQAMGREFWTTCGKAKNVQELTRLIDGVLLPSERVMITRRLRVAKRILKGDAQTKIMDDLNIGQATVDKVENWLFTADPSTRRILK